MMSALATVPVTVIELPVKLSALYNCAIQPVGTRMELTGPEPLVSMPPAFSAALL